MLTVSERVSFSSSINVLPGSILKFIQVSLQFDSTSFVFSLIIIGYQSGTMELEVYNEDSTDTFDRVITSSKVILGFLPFNVRYLHVALIDFTVQGNLTMTEEY